MLRVLIIEDLPINMLLAVAILQRAGHQALQAETAAAGMAMAREHRPDVILMDIQLPDMDGLAATRLIKADPQLHNIPVIAVTAFAMKGDEAAVRAAGCGLRRLRHQAHPLQGLPGRAGNRGGAGQPGPLTAGAVRQRPHASPACAD